MHTLVHTLVHTHTHDNYAGFRGLKGLMPKAMKPIATNNLDLAQSMSMDDGPVSATGRTHSGGGGTRGNRSSSSSGRRNSATAKHTKLAQGVREYVNILICRGYVVCLDVSVFRAMAVDSSILLLSCSISRCALGSHNLLLSSSFDSISIA